jgi:fibronectin-binding autotransporter adhesin
MKPRKNLLASTSFNLAFSALAALTALTAPSAFADTVTFSTAGTTTWTCPAGVTSISIAVQGGGGGGGSGTTTNSARGSGGGGGSCAFNSALTVVPGTIYTVTVGGGGAGSTGTGAGTGTAGTASSFSGGVISTLNAGGGGAGTNYTTATVNGGVGGTATGGVVNFSGGAGSQGRTTAGGAGGGGAGTTAVGAAGSGSTKGAGGAGSPAGGAGGTNNNAVGSGNQTAATAPGGGGGGGYRGTSGTQNGGSGAVGRITITYTASNNVKADNSDDLNLASSWTLGVPTSTEIAKWDSTVTAANTTSLGADLTFGGLAITDPAGLVTINTGNSLTLGAAATDIDLSSATQDLSLNCPLVLGAANAWDVAASRTLTLGGGVSGSAAVTKQGPGTATLSGTNTYTGNTTVTGGTLNITGTYTGDTATSSLLLGTTAAKTVVNVSNDMTLFTINGASIANSFAVYNQTAGTVTTAGNAATTHVANAGGYGYLNLTGGVYKQTANRFSVTNSTGTAGGAGVVYVGGTGTLDLTGTTSMIVGYAGMPASLTVGPGGIVKRPTAGNFWMTTNAGSYGVINIAGGSFETTGSAIRMGNSNAGTQTGFVNLAKGTLTLGLNFVTGINAASPSALYSNYAGGTLKASANLTAVVPATTANLASFSKVFGPITNNDNANSAFNTQIGTTSNFDGGLILDTNGFDVTYPSPLLGTPGNGVKQPNLTVTGGTGYTGTPMVQFTGGTGVPASGYAVIDGGAVTGIVITSPGDYSVDPTGVTLTGGGGAGASVTLSALTANPTDSGLTKSGLGTLTLSGANTYVGGTSVTGGTLRFSSAGSSTSNVTVAGGAETGALVAANEGQWINTGDLTLQNNGAVLVDYGSTTPSITVAPIKVTNFANGTTPGVRLAGASVPSLAVSQTYPLVTWTGTGPVDGSAFDLRTNRLAGTFSVSSNTLFLTVTSNSAGLPISWNTGNGAWDTSTVNWVDSSLAATTYLDTLDAVLFGDAGGATGNPIVTLATTVSPLGVTVNSTDHDYTVSGAGSISGSGALTLAPTNTRTFTLATANNSFSGGTTINGGTLALGDASNTLPATGAVVVDGPSAILSLGSNNDTVGAVSVKNGASITGSGTLTGSSYAFESGSVSALLGGTGALAKSTTGTVTLSGANTSYSGTTTVSAGTLRLANTDALASTASISLVTANTRLELGTDSAFTTLPAITGGSTLTHTIVSDRATAGAGLTHQLGTINFGSSTFDFIQGTNVTSGTTGITFDSATMPSGSAGTTVINPTTATLTITGGVTSSGSDVARTLQLDGTGIDHSIGGVITQSVASALSVTKSNTSTWTLSGANSYTGATTVSAGILNLTGNRTATAGAITVGNLNGSTGTLNVSNGTFNTGTFTVGTGDGTAIGVVNQTGGTLTLTGTQMIVGNGGGTGALPGNGGNGTYNLSGGTLTATSVASRGVMLGTNDGGSSTFNLSGTGNLLLTGALSQLMVGRADSAVDNTTNVFNQTGGSASVSILSIGGAAADAVGLNSTFSVTGGTFSAAGFPSLGVGASGVVNMNIGGTADVTLPDFPTARGSGTTATISFNGGTLRPLGASGTYMGGLTAAYIKAGGARLDTTNGSITITQSLLTDLVSTGGGLTKDGANTLTLGGANTYTGNTTVNAGTLVLVDNAQLKFVLEATSGSNNSISGAGTVTLDGDFVIDTTAADSLDSGTWMLENVSALTGAYGSNFTVVGFTDAGSNKWTKANGTKLYTFDEATGILTLGTADAYATWATAKGLTGLPGSATDPAKVADPDGDGRNNLYEFAFDGNPLSGANDGKIVGKIATVEADQVMTLTLPVRTGAAFSAASGDQLSALIDAITYRIEGDADLGTFANSISEVTPAITAGLPALSSGWSYRTFRDSGTVPTAPKVFLRAKISE